MGREQGAGTMADWNPGADLLRCVRERLGDAHRRLATTLGSLTAAEVGVRPNQASNSIANLVLHLCGHLRGGYLGEAASRDRRAEFLAEGPFDPAALLAEADRTFGAMDAYLERLEPGALQAPHDLVGGEGTLLKSLVYSLAHTTEHVGQVIVLAKAQRPEGMAPMWGKPVRLPATGADAAGA